MFDRSPLLSWYKTHIWYHNQNQNQFPISFLCFFSLKEIYTFQNNVIGEKVLLEKLPSFFFPLFVSYYIEMWQITPSYVPAFWQMIVLNTISLLSFGRLFPFFFLQSALFLNVLSRALDVFFFFHSNAALVSFVQHIKHREKTQKTCHVCHSADFEGKSFRKPIFLVVNGKCYSIWTTLSNRKCFQNNMNAMQLLFI